MVQMFEWKYYRMIAFLFSNYFFLNEWIRLYYIKENGTGFKLEWNNVNFLWKE